MVVTGRTKIYGYFIKSFTMDNQHDKTSMDEGVVEGGMERVKKGTRHSDNVQERLKVQVQDGYNHECQHIGSEVASLWMWLSMM